MCTRKNIASIKSCSNGGERTIYSICCYHAAPLPLPRCNFQSRDPLHYAVYSMPRPFAIPRAAGTPQIPFPTGESGKSAGTTGFLEKSVEIKNQLGACGEISVAISLSPHSFGSSFSYPPLLLLCSIMMTTKYYRSSTPFFAPKSVLLLLFNFKLNKFHRLLLSFSASKLGNGFGSLYTRTRQPNRTHSNREQPPSVTIRPHSSFLASEQRVSVSVFVVNCGQYLCFAPLQFNTILLIVLHNKMFRSHGTLTGCVLVRETKRQGYRLGLN